MRERQHLDAALRYERRLQFAIVGNNFKPLVYG